MAESPKTPEKIVRNATLDDIEKLKSKNVVEGIPASKVEKIDENINSPAMLKPKKSSFEPDPHPVKLPSGNKVVKRNLTDKNEIYVKRMGSIEENIFMKLLASDGSPKVLNSTIDSVIDNCIKTNINVAELSLIDKFAVFLKIIHLTYGNMKFTLTCNECKNEYKVNINIDEDLKVKYINKNFEYPFPIKIESFKDCNLMWYVKYPTIRQAHLLIAGEVSDDAMILLTDKIEGTATKEDGGVREVTKEDYEDILTNIDVDDRKKFKDFIKEFGSYGVDMTLSKDFCTNDECKLCNKKQDIDMPIDQIFSKIIVE